MEFARRPPDSGRYAQAACDSVKSEFQGQQYIAVRFGGGMCLDQCKRMERGLQQLVQHIGTGRFNIGSAGLGVQSRLGAQSGFVDR